MSLQPLPLKVISRGWGIKVRPWGAMSGVIVFPEGKLALEQGGLVLEFLFIDDEITQCASPHPNKNFLEKLLKLQEEQANVRCMGIRLNWLLV